MSALTPEAMANELAAIRLFLGLKDTESILGRLRSPQHRIAEAVRRFDAEPMFFSRLFPDSTRTSPMPGEHL